jgi:hypothetical protein
MWALLAFLNSSRYPYNFYGLNSFCRRDEVGRRVEPGLEAVASEDRLREGAGRTLPLGPAHVDGRYRILGPMLGF